MKTRLYWAHITTACSRNLIGRSLVAMKSGSFKRLALVAMIWGGLSEPLSLRATAIADSSLLFDSLSILPSSGTLEFTFQWDVKAFAEAGGNQQLSKGTATTVTANAFGPYSEAHGLAAAPNPPTLDVTARASSRVDIPGMVTAQDYGNGHGSLDGMFKIIGGNGAVDVTFSTLLTGALEVLTDQFGILAQTETIFTLELDGSPVLFDDQMLSIGPNDYASLAFSNPLSASQMLQFDTEYWIHLEVDSESLAINGSDKVPDKEPTLILLAAGLVALGYVSRRWDPGSGTISCGRRRFDSLTKGLVLPSRNLLS